MKQRKELFELKLHELKFSLKKLEIHQKINEDAMSNFSKQFKEFIYSLEDLNMQHKLKQIAGLANPSERRSSKTAQRAKQQRQYRQNKSKVQEHQEEPQPPVEIENNPLPEEYKKLYKKIANVTHPDKCRDDMQKQKIFQQVNSAVNDKNYFKLIETAIFLDIEIPDEVPLDFQELDLKIQEANNKVGEITKSVAWEWYHVKDNESKLKLIEGYASFLLQNT